MSAQPDLSKLSVGQFAERFRGEMIPLSNTFSYFCASVPLSEEDVKEYLEEPIAALPPADFRAPAQGFHHAGALFGARRRQGERRRPARRLCLHRKASGEPCCPGPPRFGSITRKCWSSPLKIRTCPSITIASTTCWRPWLPTHWSEEALAQYRTLLREELNARVHGEVDEESWHMKQGLLRRRDQSARKPRLFGTTPASRLSTPLHFICTGSAATLMWKPVLANCPAAISGSA